MQKQVKQEIMALNGDEAIAYGRSEIASLPKIARHDTA